MSDEEVNGSFDNFDDQVAKFNAEKANMLAAMGALKGYFDNLKDAGFTEAQALKIIIGLMTNQMNQSS